MILNPVTSIKCMFYSEISELFKRVLQSFFQKLYRKAMIALISLTRKLYICITLEGTLALNARFMLDKATSKRREAGG